jgi:hypothetical protein
LIKGEKIHGRGLSAELREDIEDLLHEISDFVHQVKFKEREWGKLGAGLLVKDVFVPSFNF